MASSANQTTRYLSEDQITNMINRASKFLQDLDEDELMIVPEVANSTSRRVELLDFANLVSRNTINVTLAQDLAEARHNFEVSETYDNAKNLMYWVNIGKTCGAITKGKQHAGKVAKLEGTIATLQHDLENSTTQTVDLQRQLFELEGRYSELKEHEASWFSVCPRCRYTRILDGDETHQGSVELSGKEGDEEEQ